MGPRILGFCPKCGKTIYHDSGFVRDELNVWCPEHAPATSRETPFEETVPHVIPEKPVIIGEATDESGADTFMEPAPLCSRCVLRAPMDGADFCEWCAKDDDFDLLAVTRHSTTVALNTRDCPACKVAIRRDDVQYRAGPVWYHARCAYRISKEARAQTACGPGQIPRVTRPAAEIARDAGFPWPKRTMPDGSPIWTSKGIDENLAANAQPPLDFGAPLTQEAIDAALCPAKRFRETILLLLRTMNAEQRAETFEEIDVEWSMRGEPKSATEAAIREAGRDYRDFRTEAAERLARLVLGMDKSSTVHDLAGMKIRFVHDTYLPEMVAEARRVLGEKP